ncbi:hypothetical protein KGQ71_04110, partial [Patescibacteria group bacterium]|nr:hypothetical protein [Patescibacteria group bacterium]
MEPESHTTIVSPPPEALQPFEHTLPESERFLTDIINLLRQSGDYRLFQSVDLATIQDPKELEGDIAASVIFIQPSPCHIRAGELLSGTHIILATQQEGRWEEGSLAVSMGKIELRDVPDTSHDFDNLEGDSPEERADYLKETLGTEAERTIINAAYREVREEIQNSPA